MGLISVIGSVLGAALIGLGTTSPITPPAHVPTPAVAVWPLRPPSVIRGFSPPDQSWTTGHRGVDLGGAVGAPVVASTAGAVTFAGLLAGRGVVVIGDGDTRMTYEPVIPEVQVGDLVTAGTRIGILDVTQSHCFPVACLHWGWLRGDEYLDPLQLLGEAPPVRLLPLRPADGPGGRRS